MLLYRLHNLTKVQIKGHLCVIHIEMLLLRRHTDPKLKQKRKCRLGITESLHETKWTNSIAHVPVHPSAV